MISSSLSIITCACEGTKEVINDEVFVTQLHQKLCMGQIVSLVSIEDRRHLTRVPLASRYSRSGNFQKCRVLNVPIPLQVFRKPETKAQELFLGVAEDSNLM